MYHIKMTLYETKRHILKTVLIFVDNCGIFILLQKLNNHIFIFCLNRTGASKNATLIYIGPIRHIWFISVARKNSQSWRF